MFILALSIAEWYGVNPFVLISDLNGASCIENQR